MSQEALSEMDEAQDKLKELTEKYYTASNGSLNKLNNPNASSRSSTTSLSAFNRKQNSEKINSSNVHFQYASTAYDVKMLSKEVQKIPVELECNNIMIVTKLNDVSLYYLTRELTGWLLQQYKDMTIYVDKQLENDDKFNVEDLKKEFHCKDRVQFWTTQFIDDHDIFFDLVITLGGDGTVLFVSSIFQKHVPPILSFSLGSLGFLTNFKFESFRDSLPKVINQKVKSDLRLRLECKVYQRQEPIVQMENNVNGQMVKKKIFKSKLYEIYHILNEIVIDRGPSPFLSNLELYGDNALMTVAQADGLIIATPTGSTAYSLSAGGSLVYPSVNAVCITPICPHSLSFRPIILPDSIQLKIKVPVDSRGTAWVAFDGKNRIELKRGDYITVNASPFSFPTIEFTGTEFIDSISRQLNWNNREKQKSFTHILSEKNKESYENEKERQIEEKHEIFEEVEIEED